MDIEIKKFCQETMPAFICLTEESKLDVLREQSTCAALRAQRAAPSGLTLAKVCQAHRRCALRVAGSPQDDRLFARRLHALQGVFQAVQSARQLFCLALESSQDGFQLAVPCIQTCM